MNARRHTGRWILLIVGFIAVCGAAAAYHLQSEEQAAPAVTPPENSSSADVLRVSTVQPKRGESARTLRQPGSVHVFDYQDVFSKVSGYLKVQNVDIGSRVKEGDVLAIIDAPEIVEARRQAAAEVDQAKAQVQVMRAAIDTAKAEVKAAEAMVAQSQADLKHAKAYLDYREVDFKRISELFAQKAIEEALVDESRKNLDASDADRDLKQAAIKTAEGKLAAKGAQVTQAEADLQNAKAKVMVTTAALGKAQAFESYLTLRSRYTGVVTLRNFHAGDFIQAAEQGGQIPMLSVARTDLMRVVIEVADTDAAYTFPGNEAVVTLNGLPGEEFHAPVARIADIIGGGRDEGSLTAVQNRTMRTEIDLRNPTDSQHPNGRIKGGMYGWVTIQLKIPPSIVPLVTIPSTCLNGVDKDGKDRVYVVRDGRAKGIPVKVIHENGVDIAVSGIGPQERVISKSSGSLFDGAPVEVVE